MWQSDICGSTSLWLQAWPGLKVKLQLSRHASLLPVSNCYNLFMTYVHLCQCWQCCTVLTSTYCTLNCLYILVFFPTIDKSVKFVFWRCNHHAKSNINWYWYKCECTTVIMIGGGQSIHVFVCFDEVYCTIMSAEGVFVYENNWFIFPYETEWWKENGLLQFE